MPVQPGDVIPEPTTWRESYEVWRAQWDNDAREAPNYSRTLGRLSAGFFQSRPVEYAEPPGSDQAVVLDAGDLADLTDDAAARAAGQSVAYLRPAQVNGEWTVGVLSASQVEAVWSHKRLVEAVVWTVHTEGDQKRSGVMVTETYRPEMAVELQAWEVQASTHKGWQIVQELDWRQLLADADPETVPVYLRQLAEFDTDRELVPFVWGWDDNGDPAPVHVGNEHLITRLDSLHDIEGRDANMTRRIIALPKTTLLAEAYAPAGTVLAEPGFTGRNSVLALEDNSMGAHGIDATLQSVYFEDDLIQRERIHELENAFYEACGYSPQTFGRSVSGRSDSAAAKRADQQLTMNTVAGPARTWQTALTAITAQLNKLAGLAEPPAVVVTPGPKTTTLEVAAELQALRTAEAISTVTAVDTLHPDWEDERKALEVAMIAAENSQPVL